MYLITQSIFFSRPYTKLIKIIYCIINTSKNDIFIDKFEAEDNYDPN